MRIILTKERKYLIMGPELKKIVNHRDVTFDEYDMLSWKTDKENKSPKEGPHCFWANYSWRGILSKWTRRQGSSEHVRRTSSRWSKRFKELVEVEYIAKNRPRREIREQAWFDDIIAFARPVVEGIPNNYKDAIQVSESSKLKARGHEWRNTVFEKT